MASILVAHLSLGELSTLWADENRKIPHKAQEKGQQKEGEKGQVKKRAIKSKFP